MSETVLALNYLAKLSNLASDSFDLISVDIFDTLLLRDHSVQRLRFLETARIVSGKLQAAGRQMDVSDLLDVRRRVQGLAYRAVALERPDGDTTLTRICELQALLLGLDKSTVSLFVAAELEVERRRLSRNGPLCAYLASLRKRGKRVIAISDTFLSRQNIEDLIRDLVPGSPIQTIYTSSDLGLTKQSGRIFQHVASLE